MTKSNAKSSTLCFGQGDFQLQLKRRPALHKARVQSRSCSPMQSPSPTYTPPRSKQLVYESLPRYCKQCKSLGHSTLTYTQGRIPRNKKRPHGTSAYQPALIPLQRLQLLRSRINIVQGLLLLLKRILCPQKLLQLVLLAPGLLVVRDPRLWVLRPLLLKRWALYLYLPRGSISLVVKQLPSLVWDRLS
ncbi:PREDICTED: uncharacterized protein LOC105118625 isoform X2 [Populus euphratica]|uniref:Uncharacterized protein LOC105118625 isoform X2 n=1 Tax=Populus euphratica TaxID=75702 RepID=A0AAJ6TPI4_POPEU|nr:PREDICTED: uncharacterized protein LOC105118625 isoform X2 [Populus euphratica]